MGSGVFFQKHPESRKAVTIKTIHRFASITQKSQEAFRLMRRFFEDPKKRYLVNKLGNRPYRTKPIPNFTVYKVGLEKTSSFPEILAKASF